MEANKTNAYRSSIAFYLSGGRLCLNFTNTLSWRAGKQPVEMLGSYHDLVSFCRQAGVLEENEAVRLSQQASERPDDAALVLSVALPLRETLYRIFAAAATAGKPAPEDLSSLNATLSTALASLRVAHDKARFEWVWARQEQDLDFLLWPVVRSAADLLTSTELERVRICAANNCGWLFMDTSRNHSRRWCTMGVCGNRAKANRFYQRRTARRHETAITSGAAADR